MAKKFASRKYPESKKEAKSENINCMNKVESHDKDEGKGAKLLLCT